MSTFMFFSERGLGIECAPAMSEGSNAAAMSVKGCGGDGNDADDDNTVDISLIIFCNGLEGCCGWVAAGGADVST